MSDQLEKHEDKDVRREFIQKIFQVLDNMEDEYSYVQDLTITMMQWHLDPDSPPESEYGALIRALYELCPKLYQRNLSKRGDRRIFKLTITSPQEYLKDSPRVQKFRKVMESLASSLDLKTKYRTAFKSTRWCRRNVDYYSGQDTYISKFGATGRDDCSCESPKWIQIGGTKETKYETEDELGRPCHMCQFDEYHICPELYRDDRAYLTIGMHPTSSKKKQIMTQEINIELKSSIP